jgi:ribosomal protein S18 acetylase RimI-like enzyme
LSGVQVRRVRETEWRRLRGVRLRALADAPYAFATTHAEAASQPDSFWRGMLADPAWIAEDGDRWVGLVRVRPEGAAAHLISMWVDPAARRRGVGRSLVQTVVDWAREQGFASVRLWVAGGNAGAEALYRSLGFVPTGERQPFPPDPSVWETAMRLELGSAA